MPRQKSTHVDNPAAVGARLRDARVKAGVSQRQLSFAGCTPAYISRIEAGQRIPSLQLLRELGRRLGVSADFLATGLHVSPEAALAVSLRDAQLHLRLDDVERARELFSEARARAEDDADRAAALTGLGHVALREGRARDARARYEEALELYGGDPATHPELAESLGRARALVGDPAGAAALFRRCLDRNRDRGDTIGAVRFACLLGYALTDAGEIEEAALVVRDAVERGRDVRDPTTRARLYWSQSRLLEAQGLHAEAAGYGERALEMLRLTEDTYALAHAHQLLASISVTAGRIDEAAALLDDGRRLIESTGSPAELAHFDIEQARVLARQDRRDDAIALALEATERLGGAMPLVAGEAHVLIGGLYEELGELERARAAYETAIATLSTLPPTRYLVDASTRLSSVLERLSRPAEALAAMRDAFVAQDRLNAPI